MASAAALLSALCSAWQYTTPSLAGFYAANFVGTFFLTMWLGPVAATLHDLVLPRMRGTATAILYLGITIVGMGTGPYLVGTVSDVTGSLGRAILAASGIVWIAILVAMRHIARDEASLLARARAAGELI